MKNYFLLSLSLFGSLVQGYSIRDLEEAIQNSKLKQVEIILPELQLTEKDKLRLIHLAHDVLLFRKDAPGIANVKGTTLGKKDAIVLGLGIATFFAGGAIMVAIENNPFYGFSLSMGTMLILAGAGFYRITKIGKKLADKFIKKSNNALKIKQLLMAYDADDERFLQNGAQNQNGPAIPCQ